MKFSNFRGSNYDAPTKHNLLVRNFVGIDLLNPQNTVSTQRGIYSLNYVYRDNAAQKRWAYDKVSYVKEEYFREISFETNALVSDTAILNPNVINGLWSFIADDGIRHTIAHVGYLLYEVEGIDTDRPVFKPIYEVRGTYANCAYKFENYRSTAYPGSHRLWFLGGNRFVMVYFKDGKSVVEQVGYSDYAFVPTTTIAITYANAVSSGQSGLDSVNLMSKFRRNLLLSGVGKEETDKTKTNFYEYTLDGSLVWQNEAEDMNKMVVEIEYSGIVGE